MNNLFLKFSQKAFSGAISGKHRVMLTGSCFSDDIGERFKRTGFHTCINPLGICYNPHSIFKGLNRALEGNEVVLKELVRVQETYFHPGFHGRFHHHQPEELIDLLNQSLQSARDFLQKSSFCLITLGTAWVYSLDSYGVVANCHKMPGNLFEKALLTPDEVTNQFAVFYRKLLEINQDCKVILTISPVKHIRDGLHQNSLSKASLFLGINHILELFPEVQYFGSYELVTDCLRDYRFYKNDLVHPNELAIEEVWKNFCLWAFDAETRQQVNDFQSYFLLTQHRSNHNDALLHKKHKEITRQKREELCLKYPHAAF